MLPLAAFETSTCAQGAPARVQRPEDPGAGRRVDALAARRTDDEVVHVVEVEGLVGPAHRVPKPSPAFSVLKIPAPWMPLLKLVEARRPFRRRARSCRRGRVPAR